MRTLCIIALLLVVRDASAYEHFVSPAGAFEAYTTPNAQDGTGMKLFLHRAKTHDAGILVLENMRWIDAKWSPDSQFLAVVDHNDGHIADVYVFGVRAADAAQPQITLFYHTPDPGTYDIQWDVLGWRARRREILLTKVVRNQSARRTTQERVVAHISESPISMPHQ